jgi:cytochrome P450
MGNRLGEMQLRVLWEELLKRFEHIEVLAEPERVRSNFVKGYASMQVLLHPKARAA